MSRRPFRPRRRALALAGAAVSVLAACAGPSRQAVVLDTRPALTTTTTELPTTTVAASVPAGAGGLAHDPPTVTRDFGDAPTPDGFMRHVDDDHTISIATPSSWRTMSATEIGRMSQRGLELSGVDDATRKSAAAAISFVVLGLTDDRGSSVAALSVPSRLPIRGLATGAAQQLATLGAVAGVPTLLTIDGHDAVQVDYQLQVSGTTLYGRVLAVQGSERTFEINLGSLASDRAVLDTITASVRVA